MHDIFDPFFLRPLRAKEREYIFLVPFGIEKKHLVLCLKVNILESHGYGFCKYLTLYFW